MNHNLFDKVRANRNFYLPVYLLVVFSVSWPFQGFIFFFPEAVWAADFTLVSSYIARYNPIQEK